MGLLEYLTMHVSFQKIASFLLGHASAVAGVAAGWQGDVSPAEDDCADSVGGVADGGVEEAAGGDGGWKGRDEGVEVGLVSAVACECFAAYGAVWLGCG